LTRGKTSRPSCVLLDANVVITAHELGVWDWLVRVFRVSVPSVVVHGEAQYYRPWNQPSRKVLIDLTASVASGDIAELTASVEEFTRALSSFDPVFESGLHAGETEGLALLLSGKTNEALFCSGDALAIQASAMLGLADKAVSFEHLLGGKKTPVVLEPQCTEEYLRRNLDIGRQNRITGAGLRKGLLG
jgi:hypothetical protein